MSSSNPVSVLFDNYKTKEIKSSNYEKNVFGKLEEFLYKSWGCKNYDGLNESRDGNNNIENTQCSSPESNQVTTAAHISQGRANFEADMETLKEVIFAFLYAIYGVTVAFFIALIPRRFRYKDIKGQIVLITGAGSGIGKMMAKQLAKKHGAVIVAWDINEQG